MFKYDGKIFKNKYSLEIYKKEKFLKMMREKIEKERKLELINLNIINNFYLKK